MLLTMKEVALLMRVSTRTVIRQTQKGELQAIKVGRSTRYPIEQFTDFVDSEAVKKAIRTTASMLEKAGKEGL